MIDNKAKKRQSDASGISGNAWDKNRDLVNRIVEESDSDEDGSIIHMQSSNTESNLHSGAAASA